MRLIPFVTWAKHDALQRQLAEVNKQLASLGAIIAQHQAVTAKEFFFLKNPGMKPTTVHEPLTEEQEKIVREFNENSKLPEQIRRGFASGGFVGMRAALGRFGEAPSEQTRSTDQIRAVPPGDVSVTVKVLGDTDLDDLIREDNAQRDQEAAENQELLEYLAQPKE